MQPFRFKFTDFGVKDFLWGKFWFSRFNFYRFTTLSKFYDLPCGYTHNKGQQNPHGNPPPKGNRNSFWASDWKWSGARPSSLINNSSRFNILWRNKIFVIINF